MGVCFVEFACLFFPDTFKAVEVALFPVIFPSLDCDFVLTTRTPDEPVKRGEMPIYPNQLIKMF